MTEFFDNMDIEDPDDLLPATDDLDGLPDILGDYAETDLEPDVEEAD